MAGDSLLLKGGSMLGIMEQRPVDDGRPAEAFTCCGWVRIMQRGRSRKMGRNSRSGSHLSSLTLKAANPLLAPLSSHRELLRVMSDKVRDDMRIAQRSNVGPNKPDKSIESIDKS